MTQAYAYDTASSRRRDRSALVPVDIDAAVDGPRMLMAIHERVERQFAAYEDAEGSYARQHRALRAIGAVLVTTSFSRTSCCTRRCGPRPLATTTRSSSSSSRTTCWTCSWWS